MILVLILWALIIFEFLAIGTFILKFIRKVWSRENFSFGIEFDQAFVTGFLAINLLLGYISIWLPVNTITFVLVFLISLLCLFFCYDDVKNILKGFFGTISSIGKVNRLALIVIIFFILTAVVQEITWGDTQSYHAQCIQWIRKFAVVPGLGNLHDGLAFNSMFFIASAAFTVKINDILIFPLNGICYIILITRLIILINKEFISGKIWKALLYSLLILISLLVMVPDLNSPSPDFICTTLILFLFVIIFQSTENWNSDFNLFFILSLIITSCITFKLSSLFLVLTFLFLVPKSDTKRIMIMISLIILVITPYIVRNYYLSGYLIYPYPAIDLFKADWKIPYNNVVETKSVIEAWARIPTVPFRDVMEMSFSEWVPVWFNQMSIINKLLISVNLVSVILFIITLIKKEFHLSRIYAIIIFNLLFWFLKAPDTRFAYGFLFFGFALTLAYLVKLIVFSNFNSFQFILRIGILSLFLLIVGKRISFPVKTLTTPARWIFPAQFGPVETRESNGNFLCRIPVADKGCFYTEIPCTTNLKDNLVMRGKGLKDGFKLIDANKQK